MTHPVARLTVAGIIVLAAVWPPARAAERFDVTKVAEGVYLISRTHVLAQPLDGNTVVIIGTEGVAVVDSTQTSTSANAVIAEIRRLTPAPVTYLINTHWHNDHVLGNGAYAAAFPGLQIVAHALTRDDIESEASAVLANRIRGLANRGQAQATLDAGRTAAGKPLSRAETHRLRERLAMPASHLEDLKAIVVTPPTVTYRGRMTLQLGGREVQLFSNGPGNTRSDTVVWLPADRVVATGDLLVSTVPFMSVSFPRGWLARLKEIETLTPAVIIPGHGPVQRDLTWLHRHAELLESLITQVDAALDKGLTLEQTRARVNLDAFRHAYAGGNAFLADEFDFRVTEPAVADAYRERVGQTVPTTVLPSQQTMVMTRPADGVEQGDVSGVVFIDANGNGIHDRGEQGLANAVVSNQDAVVATDASGAYRLPRRTTGVLFVSVPDGYRTIGAFWRKMEAATSTVDFPLSPADQPAEFTFIHASDPHIAPAVLARTQRFRALADSLNPAFVLITGDLVRDALRVGEAEATGYYALFNREAALFKNPVWTVPGNHEIFGVERDRSQVTTTHPLYGRQMYHHYRGPDYYSFTFGGVHFVGLNTVDVEDQSYCVEALR